MIIIYNWLVMINKHVFASLRVRPLFFNESFLFNGFNGASHMCEIVMFVTW